MLPALLSPSKWYFQGKSRKTDRQTAGSFLSSLFSSHLVVPLFYCFLLFLFPSQLSCLTVFSQVLQVLPLPLKTYFAGFAVRILLFSLHLTLCLKGICQEIGSCPTRCKKPSYKLALHFSNIPRKQSLINPTTKPRATPTTLVSLALMDFYLKQWKIQQESESEEQHFAKMPRLMLESHLHPPHSSPSSPALPLFVPELNTKVSSLTALSDSSLATTRFPRMGSYFSVAQSQELELQALIFRYMSAGVPVPSELLLPIKKSLLHSAPYFLHYQPPLLQSGYWGGATMDPEPGRCRRTDGKKWRCSKDVVAGQKYCERHMHRGRNRSRKPVEVPTPTTAGGAGSVTGGGGGCPAATTASISASHMTTTLGSPFDLLQLKRWYSLLCHYCGRWQASI